MRGFMVFVGIAGALSGCFSPSFESGKIECGPGNSCPSGLRCEVDGKCYRRGDEPFDAAVPADAMPDRGPVTIRAVDNGAPLVNRVVVFHEPDGAIAGVVKTDNAGEATHELRVGGGVTIDLSNDQSSSLGSLFGLLPFNTYVVGDLLSSEVIRNVKVSYTPYANATRHVVRIGNCTGTSDPAGATPGVISVDVMRRCVSPDGTLRVLLTAHTNDAYDFGIAFAVSPDLPAAGSGDLIVTFANADWSTAYTDFVLEVAGIPASVVAACNPADAGTAQCPGVNWAGYTKSIAIGPEPTTMTVESNGTGSAGLSYPAPAFDGLAYAASFELGTAPDVNAEVRRYFHSLPTHDDANLALQLLPQLVSSTVDAADPSRPVVAYTSASPLTAADVVAAFLTYRLPSDAGGTSVRWTHIGNRRPDQRVVFPPLPDDLAALRPHAGASFPSPATLALDTDATANVHELIQKLGLDALFEAPEALLPSQPLRSRTMNIGSF